MNPQAPETPAWAKALTVLSIVLSDFSKIRSTGLRSALECDRVNRCESVLGRVGTIATPTGEHKTERYQNELT
jgi:hypothetical protein